MSVLPQLERELLAAHGRRRAGSLSGRVTRRAGSLALLVAGAATTVVVVAAFGLLGRTTPAPAPGSVPRILLRGVQVDSVHTAGAHVYVVAGASLIGVLPDGRSVKRTFGRFHGLPSWIIAVQPAFGRLWVTTGDEVGYTRLWQLDPSSLRPLALPLLLAGMGTGDNVGLMAARGVLWVTNGDTIDVVSPVIWRVIASHPVLVLGVSATGVDIAASASTTDLYVSGAAKRAFIGRVGQGPGLLGRHITVLPEPYAPAIVGVWGGGVWVLRFDGRRVRLDRFEPGPLGSLGLARDARQVVASKGLLAQLSAGILWVTDTHDRPGLNYCADPRTGQPRAPLSLPAGAQFLTADSRFLYFTVGAARSPALARMAIDPRCR